MRVIEYASSVVSFTMVRALVLGHIGPERKSKNVFERYGQKRILNYKKWCFALPIFALRPFLAQPGSVSLISLG